MITISQLILSKEKQDCKDLWYCEVLCISVFSLNGRIYLGASVLLTKSIQYGPFEISFSTLRPSMTYSVYCLSCFAAHALRDTYVWRLGKIRTMVTQALILLAGPFSLCSVLWLKIIGNVSISRYKSVFLLEIGNKHIILLNIR